MDNIIPFLPQQRHETGAEMSEIERIRALRGQGLSLGEIAAMIGMPKSTVAHRLKYGEASLPTKGKCGVVQGPVLVLTPPLSLGTDDEGCCHPSTADDFGGANGGSDGHSCKTVQDEVLDELPPCVQSCNVQGRIVQDDSCKGRAKPSKIVQYGDCTKQMETKHQAGAAANLLHARVATQGSCTAGVLDDSRSAASWTTVARCGLLLLPVVALTPWLVATAAKVYARDVGSAWGWFLAVGIEAFVVALAVLAPSAVLKASSPREFAGSLVHLGRGLVWYALLLGVGIYSYQTSVVQVVEERAVALSSVAAASDRSEEVTALRNERTRLLESVTRFEKEGWLGEARKIREDLRTVEVRIEAARTQVATATPASVVAIEHRVSVSRYLRILVLLINVVCLHLLVKTISSARTSEKARCA